MWLVLLTFYCADNTKRAQKVVIIIIEYDSGERDTPTSSMNKKL